MALLVGACVAPTDPVLARTIAIGRLARENVPDRVAHTLLGESSVNDGAALILVVLMVVLLPQGGHTLQQWFTATVIWAVGGALPLGFLLGWLGARFERWVFGLPGETPPLVRIAFPISLAILSLMLLRTVHVDGVLGVFVSGLAFNAFREKEDRQSEEALQEIVDDLFGVIIFFVFGLALPWDAWAELGWRLAPLVVGILVLRRLPWMLALSPLLRPQIRGVREVVFIGWFGPIGVSALFYATLLVDDGVSRIVWPVVAAVVTASVLVFGVTGAPLTRWLGRHEVPAREEG
jgi:NhaP-type Na+/H+ or K+/H+ antiporter